MSDPNRAFRLPDLTRRDFLKGVGGAIGGSALLGGGGASAATLPSGYTFYRVIVSGRDASGITPAVMISRGSPLLYFHGTHRPPGAGSDVDALLLARMDWSAPRPRFTSISEVLVQGNRYYAGELGDDSDTVLASGIGTGDVNALGHYATTIASQTSAATAPVDAAPGVWLLKPEVESGNPMVRVARYGDPAPDGGQYGGIYGDVSLADDDTVAFVTFTTGGQAGTPYQGLFAAPPGAPADASVVLRTGQLLPESTATITAIGLVDVARDRRFVAQVRAAHFGPAASMPGAHPTALVEGRLGGRAAALGLVAASSRLEVHRGAARRIVRGETIYGPRIGRRGRVGHVLHTTDHEHGVYFRRNRRSRGLSHSGRAHKGAEAVASVGASVVSDSGLVFYTDTLSNGMVILSVTDGTTTRALMQSGDTVDGAVVSEILHGYHPSQVDDAGRLVFAAEFYTTPPADPLDPNDPANLDQNNIYTAVVVGIPT